MRNYKIIQMLHSQFIFGYNLERKVFKCMNFSSDTKNIEVVDLMFDNLSEEFLSEETRKMFFEDNVSLESKGKGYRIALLKPKTSEAMYVNNSLNKEFIREQIRQYVNSVNSSLNTIYFTGHMEGTWGVDIYDGVIKQLQEQDQRFDIRMICLLHDHKIFMEMRLDLFNPIVSEEYKQVVDDVKTLKNISLKYLFTKQKSIVERIIKLLHVIRENEIRILEKFLLE